MDETTLICDCTIAANQHVFCDGLSEDLHLENICDDLFCFPIYVWMDQGDMVVACNNISESR